MLTVLEGTEEFLRTITQWQRQVCTTGVPVVTCWTNSRHFVRRLHKHTRC